MSLLLMTGTSPAIADDGVPTRDPSLRLGAASGVLTLPAGDGVRDSVTFALTSESATR